MIATYCSTLAGLPITSMFQKIRLYDPVILGYLGGMTALIAGLVVWFGRLDQAAMETQSSILANFLIFAVIIAFMAGASNGESTSTIPSSKAPRTDSRSP